MAVIFDSLPGGPCHYWHGQCRQRFPPCRRPFSIRRCEGQQQSQYSDNFDSLKPAGLKGISMSTLVNSGKVHVNNPSRSPGASIANLFVPLLNITWGADMLTGSGAGEPGVGINQTLPIYALVSGKPLSTTPPMAASPGPPSSLQTPQVMAM